MAVRRVGADDDGDVRLLDGIEVLRAGRGAEGGLEAVARRRMADTRAGIDIVVAEALAHQLLHQVGLLVGAARGGDAADRAAAVLMLQPLELAGDVAKRLLPRDLAPRIGDLLADHRLEDAVLVVGVAVGEAALHAGVPPVRLAGLVGHHADEFAVLHLRLEGTADAAIGAGGDDRAVRHALLDHRLLFQRPRRAGLHAGAAGDAFGRHEGLVHAGRDPAFEAAPLDRQGEGALLLLAGAHAQRTDDALRRIVGEVRVRLVLGDEARIDGPFSRVGNVIVAVEAVAVALQADLLGHAVHLALAGGAGRAVLRMVRHVEFHDAPADLLQPVRLRADHHAVGDGRRARGGRAAPPLDLDEAHAA